MDCKINLEKLLAPYMHLTQVKSKQFRNKIVLAFNHWFKVPDDLVQNALNAMTMTHNASLLIDDIQDNSIKRRGIHAAHCIYGIPLTINTALHVLVLALKQELDLVPAALGGNIFVEHVLDVIYGQGVEIYWRDNFLCPTEAEYKEMVQQKTGAMLLYGVKLIQVLSDDRRNYDDFVKLLGFYFQLRDDYCNLKQIEALEEYPGEEDVNKEMDFCEDITEGKFSLPIIHAMKTPQGPKILSILRQRTRDIEVKKYCLSLIEKSGSLQYTRDLLSELDREARKELFRLGGNPLMEDVLDGLLSWKGSENI